MDGLEVLRNIRRDDRTRLIPVVILTSSLEEQDLLNGYGPGTNSYVRKTRGLQSVQRGDAAVGTLMVPLERPPPGSGMGENSGRNPATGTPFSLTFLPLVHKLPRSERERQGLWPRLLSASCRVYQYCLSGAQGLHAWAP